MRFLAVSVVVCVLLSVAAAGQEGSRIQELAAARGGEAMDFAVQIGDQIWTGFDPEGLSLLIVEPGAWTVLINHPGPPKNFEPMESVPRRRVDPTTGDAHYDKAEGAVWSAHVGGADTLPDLAWRATGTTMLGGRRTAIVRFNEVSRPVPSAPGWPMAEASIDRMVRALWIAGVQDREGPLLEPLLSWNYRLDADGLALAIADQRLLGRLARTMYNEKTRDRYIKLAGMWLAVRQKRLALDPAAVAVEEALERRLGMADFGETCVFRVVPVAGNVIRPHLESIDPFYDRFRGFVLMRIHLLNAPLFSYPSTPLQALQSTRARGAALAFAAWPMAPRWYDDFYATQPGGARRTLREVISGALRDEPVMADPNAILAEALELEGHEEIRGLVPAMLARAEAAGLRRETALLPEGRPRIVLDLGGAPLEAFATPFEMQDWLGPRRVLLTGPVRMSFRGGDFASEEHSWIIQGAEEAAAGGNRGPASLTGPLPAVWRLTAGGREVRDLPAGSKPVRLEAPLELSAPGFRLRLETGEAALSASGIRIRSLSLNDPPSSDGNQN